MLSLLSKSCTPALLLVAVVVSLLSCSASNSHEQTIETMEAVDEAGRTLRVPLHIERVVSLAPNLTEIVFAIGAGNLLVGNTTFCDYPADAKSIEKVGDTLKPNIERIIALRPQLVFVSTASQLEAFAKQLDERGISVYVNDPRDLHGVFISIRNIGNLLSHHNEAESLVKQLQARVDAVEKAVADRGRVTVFYQLSAEPLYTAGREAFVTDLIARAGGISVTATIPGAWPIYSGESALAARPDAIILPTGGSMSSDSAEVAAVLKNSPAVLNGRVYKINDDYLTRPGPRAVDGLEQLAKALHPEVLR